MQTRAAAQLQSSPWVSHKHPQNLLKTGMKSQEKLQICIVPQVSCKGTSGEQQPARRVRVDLQTRQLTQPWAGTTRREEDQITSPQGCKGWQHLVSIKQTKQAEGC